MIETGLGFFMAAEIKLWGDFSGDESRQLARAMPRREAGPAPAGSRRDPPRGKADGRRTDRRGWAADRAGLGPALQRRGSGRARRPRGARQGTDALGGAARRPGADGRGWPGAVARRGSPLAAGGSRPMALGGVPGLGERDDREGRTADARLPQALRPAAPPRPRRRSVGRFQKSSRSAWRRSGPRIPASA